MGLHAAWIINIDVDGLSIILRNARRLVSLSTYPFSFYQTRLFRLHGSLCTSCSLLYSFKPWQQYWATRSPIKYRVEIMPPLSTWTRSVLLPLMAVLQKISVWQGMGWNCIHSRQQTRLIL